MPPYAKMCLRFLVVGLVVAFSGILGVARTRGATPEAWAAHEKEVVTACAAASKLRDPKPGGSAVDFDDRVGFTALIIDGYYPQPHLKNKRGRVLCIFDKRTRTGFVSAADSIVWRRQP
jgi:hypothetical protein